MFDIALTGKDSAEGIWYLESIFIGLEDRLHRVGSAICRDQHWRVDGVWKIASSEYDGVFEMIRPLPDDPRITTHYLADVGRKPEECTDISHRISSEVAEVDGACQLYHRVRLTVAAGD